MPQIFQVLKCYKCSVFQIHQTKKSIKFECKVCGEKQSIKRHYGIGSGKDCRMHVQRLNLLRCDMETKSNIESNSDEEYGDSKIDKDELENVNNFESKPMKRSKWSEFVDVVEETEATEDPMFLGDREVLLEIPQKRKSNIMKYKTKSNNSGINSHNPNEAKVELKSNCSFNKKSDIELKNIPQDNIILNNNDISSRKQLANNNINVIEDLEKAAVDEMLNKNSRWAQFIDTNQISAIDTNVMMKNKQDGNGHSDVLLKRDVSESCSRLNNLFSLCDDNELDQVLDV